MGFQSISLASNLRTKGILFVLSAGVLWGVSGTIAQYLFHNRNISTEWLVVVRLLISGLFLLLLAYKHDPKLFLAVWKNKQDRMSLVAFGILGMLAVQYTYFAAIDHGNAATATVLQYLAPVLVTCYAALRNRRLPIFKEVVAVCLAVSGTFFLVTQGQINRLSISGWALFWGLTSAFALAFYTIQPKRLLDKWGSIIVMGWGMLIGGAGFSFIHPPWKFEGDWSSVTFLAVLFVIFFGTLIPFYMYLESLKYISATEATLLACIEPLAAVVFSVIWLQVSFGVAEWFGTLLIVSTIFVLTVTRNKKLVRSK